MGHMAYLCIYKGKYYWRFNGKEPDGLGLPILISEGFPGIPNDVDTAFVWSGNQKLYFFKGTFEIPYKSGIHIYEKL